MSNTINRIKQYIDYKGISVRKFEKEVGFSNGAFASQFKNGRSIGIDKVENILQSYSDINPNWLLTGEGDMIKKIKETNILEKNNIIAQLSEDKAFDNLTIERKLKVIYRQNIAIEKEIKREISSIKKKVDDMDKKNNKNSQSIYSLGEETQTMVKLLNAYLVAYDKVRQKGDKDK